MSDTENLRGSAASVALSSLISACSLGLAAIVIARTLGPEGRGAFAASYSLLYLLVITGSLGIGPGGRRLLAMSPYAATSLRDYAQAARWLVVAQAPMSLAIGALLLPFFGAGRTPGEIVAVSMCAVATLASLLAREALYGVGRSRLAALILAAGCVFTLFGVAVVAWLGHATVTSFLLVYALAAVGESLAAASLARRSASPIEESAPAGARAVLRSGKPIVLLLVAQAVATRGDRLVVGAIAGPAELGLYAVAVSGMELLAMGSFALGQVSFRHAARGDAGESIRRVTRQTILMTAACAVAVVAAAPWLVAFAFGSEFDGAVPALRILALAAVPFGSLQIDMPQLIAQDRGSTAAVIGVGAAASMVGGDLLLVPIWGIEGAACTTVAVYSIFAVLSRQRLNAGSSN